MLAEKSTAATFVLRLRSTRSDRDAIRSLRWLLKGLLRQYSLRCISAEEIPSFVHEHEEVAGLSGKSEERSPNE
jgi:hypothetical protein